MCGRGNTWGTRGTTLGDTTMCGVNNIGEKVKKPHEEQIETHLRISLGTCHGTMCGGGWWEHMEARGTI
jgi:hypothetical protein